MQSTICTIGFAGKTAEEFFRLLREAGVRKVIDIRENRTGQLSGFAKYPDIAFFLERVAGISYSYEPRLAPSVEIRKVYRNGRDWALYETSFLDLMRKRSVLEDVDPSNFEGTVAFLCSEPHPEKCHRRLVTNLLAEYFRSAGHRVEIRHLFSEQPAKKRKKVPVQNDGPHPK